jgi:hypothetical protein
MMAKDSVVLDDKKLQSIIRNEPQRVQQWLDGFTVDLLSRIVLSFGASPSSPGEPPGVDTGALRASMHWEHDGSLRNTISDGVEYGLHLEDGTETIAPRPFIAPAFADAQQRVGPDAKANLGIEDL